MTIEEWLRLRARRYWQVFFCSICKIHPPKWAGGPCDMCYNELGRD